MGFGRQCHHINISLRILVTAIVWLYAIDMIHKKLDGRYKLTVLLLSHHS